MSVAQTILQQLGGKRFIAMTGAKQFMALEDGLSFLLPDRKINRVKIRLNACDFYDVEFGLYRKFQYKPVKLAENIGAEDLTRIFTETTGLDTRL